METIGADSICNDSNKVSAERYSVVSSIKIRLIMRKSINYLTIETHIKAAET